MIFAMSPIPNMMPNMAPKWCPNGPQNRSKIDPKTNVKFERILASFFDRFFVGSGSQDGSKRVPPKRGWPPWGRLGRHIMIFDVKNDPKVIQRCPKVRRKSLQNSLFLLVFVVLCFVVAVVFCFC